MVFRSIWQGLQNVLGAGMNDDDVKAQAIQDPAQTQNLIAIENARGAVKLKLVICLGLLALLALVVVVGALLVIVEQAGQLRLPWSRIGTIVGTFLTTSGITGLVAWWWKRLLKRRQTAAASSGNPSANPAEGDQNQVGTS
ncbi:hypothetical protein ACHBTE_03360 [Streptomyces sp. M41]|uniref:hypothetical protein n=1 Tax=Streptomyces sp. M41 TaxID=3059412 RepID=UPI00374CC164